MSEKQERFINELITAIVAMMTVVMPWAGTHNINTSKEASDMIKILIGIRDLLVKMKVNKAIISTEFVETVRNGIAVQPTMAWINARQMELANMTCPSRGKGAIAIWRQAKINSLLKELGDKLSDEQKDTIKAKMATEGDDWANNAITKLLKIKSS